LFRDGLALVLLGLLGFCLYPFLFTAALRHAEAALAALALPLIPLLTLVLGAALGRERLTARKLVGVTVAGVGVSGAYGFDTSALPGAALFGGALMLGAAASSAAYNVLAPPLVVRRGSLGVVLVATAAGTMALALVTLPVLLVQPLTLDAAGWGVIALVGAANAGASLLWAAALKVTPPSSVAVFTTLIPVVAALSGAMLLDEPITVSLFAGFALVATGILIVNIPRLQYGSMKPQQH
jgi:drug/metabolite transporter (DMT)-like permease